MANYTDRFYSNDFDSKIDYQDLTLGIHDYVLTLILRVWLRQLNPPNGQARFVVDDGSGNQAYGVAWGADEWMNFKDQFKRQTYRAWNNAFVLIPPANFNGFVDDSGVRRNVRCFLEIAFASEPASNVHVINAARIADAVTVGDYLMNSSLRANAGAGSSPGFFASTDVTPKPRNGSLVPEIKTTMVNGKMQYSGGTTHEGNYAWEQHVFPHEVGHLLGLNHVNARAKVCKNDGNAHICYGGDSLRAINIMGEGDALDEADAAPWRKRIPRHAPHTQETDWKVDFASSEARLRGLWSIHST